MCADLEHRAPRIRDNNAKCRADELGFVNYRFQKVTTVYPAFARRFLNSNPDINKLSYHGIYERLVGTRYGWSDYYGKHIGALGNATQEIFADVEPLQKAWARENGCVYREASWLKDIVLYQMKSFKPDVIFLQDLYLFDPAFRKDIRASMSGRKTILAGYRSAYTDDYGVFRDLDIVFACVPNFVRRFREHGARAELLRLAFEPEILRQLDVGTDSERPRDFVFIGNLGSRDGVHSERCGAIDFLMRHTTLEVWGEEPPQLQPSSALARLALHGLGNLPYLWRFKNTLEKFMRSHSATGQLRAKALSDMYPDRVHQPDFGLPMYRILGESKLALNKHIDCAEECAGNVRMFETTGMGACLITDLKPDLAEIFQPDLEIATYSGPAECAEKARYLLDHPSEMRAIALAGQRRTLRDHTFQKRAEYLDEILRGMLRE